MNVLKMPLLLWWGKLWAENQGCRWK